MIDQTTIEHYKEALKIRRELVEIDKSFKPKLADALNNLGVAYRGKGLLDQAIQQFTEALEIRRDLVEIDECFKPKLAKALDNLANTYYGKGSLDQAIECYEEALEIHRKLVEVESNFNFRFMTSLILLGIAFGLRGTEEDKVRSKRLQIEVRSILEDPVAIKRSQYPDLVSLARILDSLVSEN